MRERECIKAFILILGKVGLNVISTKIEYIYENFNKNQIEII